MGQKAEQDDELPLLPRPRDVTLVRESREAAQTRIRCADAAIEAEAARLLEGLDVGPVTISIAAHESTPHLGMDEDYTLRGDGAAIELRSATPWGALRGLGTLYQLAGGGTLPAIFELSDGPRYPWRGLLLDPARHFIAKEALLNVLDGMALLKLNVLHLHLTDDQGFRLPSRRLPKLPSEQHYTADELMAVIERASALGIRVVPELDMPGHVTSWLTAYPEWAPASFREAVAPTDRFGVHAACLDPSNPAVYEAVEALFDELVELFPDEWVHVGGDEVHPTWWQQDPGVQAYAASQGWADNGAIQNAFMTRVVEMLRARGRRAVGWDEVLHAEMPDLVVQNWRGATTRDLALSAGRDAIVSAPFYFDLHFPAGMHYAFDVGAEQATLVEVEDRQQLDPRLAHVAGGIEWTRQWRSIDLVPAANERGALLGGEACLWSELVSEEVLPTRLWSRLPAVAERLWSDDVTSEAAFYDRLSGLLALPAFDHAGRQRRALAALGYDETQIEYVLLLEPIKWYGRLLGQTALQARLAGEEMPQARPYRLDSTFDRAIDHLSPESLSARAYREASLDDWRTAGLRWSALEPEKWPPDVRDAIAGLAELGALIVERGRQLDTDTVWRLYGPYGDPAEYLLAVVPPLVAFLE